MIVAALDLATKTGVAVGEPGTRPILFTEKFTGGHGQRFAQSQEMTQRIIRRFSPAVIVIEAPLKLPRTSADVELVLMGLRACVLAEAYRAHIPTQMYAVQTIRRHFIGTARLKRKAAKSSTIARCEQLGWHPNNDDEADAAALWDLACSMTSRSHSISRTPLFGRENVQ